MLSPRDKKALCVCFLSLDPKTVSNSGPDTASWFAFIIMLPARSFCVMAVNHLLGYPFDLFIPFCATHSQSLSEVSTPASLAARAQIRRGSLRNTPWRSATCLALASGLPTSDPARAGDLPICRRSEHHHRPPIRSRSAPPRATTRTNNAHSEARCLKPFGGGIGSGDDLQGGG